MHGIEWCVRAGEYERVEKVVQLVTVILIISSLPSLRKHDSRFSSRFHDSEEGKKWDRIGKSEGDDINEQRRQVEDLREPFCRRDIKFHLFSSFFSAFCPRLRSFFLSVPLVLSLSKRIYNV